MHDRKGKLSTVNDATPGLYRIVSRVPLAEAEGKRGQKKANTNIRTGPRASKFGNWGMLHALITSVAASVLCETNEAGGVTSEGQQLKN